MIYKIKQANWHTELADVIEKCDDGDTIVLNSHEKKELAKGAIKRMRPMLMVTILVEQTEEMGW